MKKILYCGMFSVMAFNVCEANQFFQVKAQPTPPGQSIKTQIPNNGMALRTGQPGVQLRSKGFTPPPLPKSSAKGNSPSGVEGNDMNRQLSSPASRVVFMSGPVVKTNFVAPKHEIGKGTSDIKGSSSGNGANVISGGGLLVTPDTPASQWSPPASGVVGSVAFSGSQNADYFFNIGKRLSACRTVKEIKLSGAELTDVKVDALLKGLDSCDGVTHIETFVFEEGAKISDEWLRKATGGEKNKHGQICGKKYFIETLKGDNAFIKDNQIIPTMGVKFSNERTWCLLYDSSLWAIESVFQRQTGNNVDVWINGRSLADKDFTTIANGVRTGYEKLGFNFHLTGFDDKKLFCFACALWKNQPARIKTINRLDLSNSRSVTPGGIESISNVFARAGIKVENLIPGPGAKGEAQPLMTIEYNFGKEKVNVFDANIGYLKEAVFPPFSRDLLGPSMYNELEDVYLKLKFRVYGRGKDVEFFKQIGEGIASVFNAKLDNIGDSWSIDLGGNEIDDDRIDAFIDPIVENCHDIKFKKLDLSHNLLSCEAIERTLTKLQKTNVLIRELNIDSNPGTAKMKPIVEITDGRSKKIFYKEQLGSVESFIKCLKYGAEFKVHDCSKDDNLVVYRDLGEIIFPHLGKIGSIDLSKQSLSRRAITFFLRGLCSARDALDECRSRQDYIFNRGSSTASRRSRIVINRLVLEGAKMTNADLLDIIDECDASGIGIASLDIDNNPNMGTAGGIISLYAYRKMEELSRVSHEGCNIDDDTLNRLEDMESEMFSLHKDIPAKNKRDGLGADAIRALKEKAISNVLSSESKEEIDLSARIISDADVPQLIELLKLLRDKGVRHVLVDLSRNFLTDIGVGMIITNDVFTHSGGHLIELKINENLISEKVLYLMEKINQRIPAYIEQEKELESKLGEQAKTAEESLEQAAKVQESVESLNTQIEALRAQLDELETERNALMKEWDGLDKQMDELSADSLPVKETCDSMTRILEDKEEDIGKLNLFVDYSGTIRENKKEIERLQREVDGLNNNLIFDKSRIETNNMEIDELERQLCDMQAEKESEKDRGEAKGEIKEPQEETEDNEEGKETIESLQEGIRSRKEDVKKAENDIKETKGKITILQNAIAEMQEENAKLDAAHLKNRIRTV